MGSKNNAAINLVNSILLTVPPYHTNYSNVFRWKEIAGVTFREVNRLRSDLTSSDTERMNQKTQLAMIKGELALSKCGHRLPNSRRRRSLEDVGNMAADNSFQSDYTTNPYYNRWLGNRWQSVPDVNKEADDSTGGPNPRHLTSRIDQNKRAYGAHTDLRSSSPLARVDHSLHETRRRLPIDRREVGLIHEAFQRQAKTLESLRNNNSQLEKDVKGLLEKAGEDDVRIYFSLLY